MLDQVNKTRSPLRATRRGKPLADVIPPVPEAGGRDWIGSMAGTIEFLGDVVSPVIDVRDRLLGLGKIATLASR